jgi:branched-chain amino acid transport system permease protein
MSLNLEMGYGGVPNFGKVLVVAGGAFVAGWFPGRLLAMMYGVNPSIDYISRNGLVMALVNARLGQEPLTAILVFIATLGLAAVVGGILGLVSSYPAIRLKEDYLAITLIAMGELVKIVGYNYTPLVGGTLGVQVPDFLAFVGSDLRFTAATVTMLAVAAVIFITMGRLMGSPLGRLVRAVRDDPVAASALGKDVVAVRSRVMIVGSAIGAIGGALYAFYTSATLASAYTRTDWTFWPWVMVMLGGAGNNKGALVGSFTFVTARKLIIFYKHDIAFLFPFDVTWLDPILLGVTLIVLLMYRPQGLIPEGPTYTLGRKRLEEAMTVKGEERVMAGGVAGGKVQGEEKPLGLVEKLVRTIRSIFDKVLH